MMRMIGEVDAVLFGLVLVIFIIQVYLSSFRWYLLNRTIDVSTSYRTVAELVWIGLFFNQVLPTGVGGDVVRGYMLAKKNVETRKAISSVLWDRITGMLGLVVMVFLGLVFFGDFGDSQLFYAAAIALLFVGITLILLYNERFFSNRFKFFYALSGFAEDGRRLLMSLTGGSIVIVLSFLVQLLVVLGVYLIGIGVDVELNMIALFVVAPISVLMMALPFSLAGWGVREGVMVGGLSMYGASVEQALAISILFGVELLLIGLIGGLFVLNHGTERERYF